MYRLCYTELLVTVGHWVIFFFFFISMDLCALQCFNSTSMLIAAMMFWHKAWIPILHHFNKIWRSVNIEQIFKMFCLNRWKFAQSWSSCSLFGVNLVGGTLLPHQSYGTYPFGQPPQIIPAVSPLTPRPQPFGFPPIFYWPYPSPPVSPTNYYGTANGSAATAAAAAAMSAAAGGVNNGSGLPAGTLVIMRGLPFTASCSDILQFFSGFSEVRGLSSDKTLLSFFIWLLFFCHYLFLTFERTCLNSIWPKSTIMEDQNVRSIGKKKISILLTI